MVSEGVKMDDEPCEACDGTGDEDVAEMKRPAIMSDFSSHCYFVPCKACAGTKRNMHRMEAAAEFAKQKARKGLKHNLDDQNERTDEWYIIRDLSDALFEAATVLGWHGKKARRDE